LRPQEQSGRVIPRRHCCHQTSTLVTRRTIKERLRWTPDFKHCSTSKKSTN
jgi:hypothetical protein